MAPRGVICSLGGMFTPLFTPRGEHSLGTTYLEEWRGEQIISPQGTKFTPGGQLRPLGQSLPLGAKLRMGLCIVMALNLDQAHENYALKIF
jgi:hypothetical protein